MLILSKVFLSKQTTLANSNERWNIIQRWNPETAIRYKNNKYKLKQQLQIELAKR